MTAIRDSNWHERIRFHASYYQHSFSPRIELCCVMESNHYGKGYTMAIAQPLTLVERKPEEDGMPLTPFMVISSDEAQGLMDALWRVGIRPTEGQESSQRQSKVT